MCVLLANAVVRVEPVRGATHYEFELSTSTDFAPRTASSGRARRCVCRRRRFRSRFRGSTGERASLYWHVRAVAGARFAGVTRALQHGLAGPAEWRQPNDAIGVAPSSRASRVIRWTPVDGATGYQVWFANSDDFNGLIVRPRRSRIRRRPARILRARPTVRNGDGACGTAGSTAGRRTPSGRVRTGRGAEIHTTKSDSAFEATSSRLETVSTRLDRQAAPDARLRSGLRLPANDDRSVHHVYVATERTA